MDGNGAMARAVLFDFDLTLVDSAAGISACVNRALAAVGLPPSDPDCVRRLIGHPLAEIFAELAPSHLCDELIRAFLEHEETISLAVSQPFAVVPEVLHTLGRQGYRLGIVSTKPRRKIEHILAPADLVEHFDVIVGGDEVRRLKPDPEGVERAIRAIGERVSSWEIAAVYVGDSLVDAATAAAAGLPFIGVLTGATEREALLAAGAELVLEDLAGLPEYLMGRADAHAGGRGLRDLGGPF